MKKLILLFVTLQSFLGGSMIGQQIIPISTEKWNIFAGEPQTVDGREAFAGLAILKEVQFHNGTIEWDMKATGVRSYAGIFFRQQPNRNFEEFYVRPHKTNGLNADACQYTPAYHGVSCWQLYHGDGGTQAATLPSNEWVHYKMVVDGTRAMVTMETDPKQTMLIHKLALGDISGSIGVKGPPDRSVLFSNFSWSPNIEPLPDPLPATSPIPGLVRDWEITQAFTNDRADSYRYYTEQNDLKWTKITAPEDGLINLTREVIRNPLQPGWLYARTTIHSDQTTTARYQLGYSDFITIFVNGEPVYSGTNAYTSRDPGFAGLVGWFDEVFLPLKPGDNELTLLIGEQFGGWGFQVRDGNAVYSDPSIEQKWELVAQMNYPESAAYDPNTSIVYVSNYLQGMQEFISKVSLDGEILDLKWAPGLRRPTGLCIANGKLWAVERTEVAEIDMSSGEILNRTPLEGCVFPNDITFDPVSGSLFVSDNEADRIYRIKEGAASVWMEGGALSKPNGLKVDGNRLLVGCTGEAALKSINLETKAASVLARLRPGAIMDGIQPLGDGRILFSDFNGHLYLLGKNQEVKELLNSTTIQTNLADFEWIPSKKLLIIPGLYSNKLGGYRFDPTRI